MTFHYQWAMEWRLSNVSWSASDSIISEDSCVQRAASNSTQCLAGSFSFAFLPSLILLFSSLLAFFILPLVQSHYWHFCQSAAENAVSNTSNQQFPLSFLLLVLPFFSLFSIPDNGWRGQTMYSCHLTPPPPPPNPLTPPPLTSVVSSQALGRVVRGWTLRSNQSLCRL